MILDREIIISSATAAGARLLAQTEVVNNIPGLTPIANLTATAALIYLVVWMTTKTVPAMQDQMAAAQEKSNASIERIVKDFREESALLRADREKDRERFSCRHDGDN